MKETRSGKASLRGNIITAVLRFALKCLCRIDSRDLERLDAGPLILVVNHINFLEVPILAAWLYPRPMRGLVKKETWNNRVMGFLMDTYKAIPVDREGMNLAAFRTAREFLEEGGIITIAPEGTRSGDGVLLEGKAGVIHLALAAGVPLLPLGHFGGEKIWNNLKRLRRTAFTFRAGRPFRLKPPAHPAFPEVPGRPGKEVREKMLEEVMYQLAALLPEPMRGFYANPPEGEPENPEYLEFLDLSAENGGMAGGSA